MVCSNMHMWNTKTHKRRQYTLITCIWVVSFSSVNILLSTVCPEKDKKKLRSYPSLMHMLRLLKDPNGNFTLSQYKTYLGVPRHNILFYYYRNCGYRGLLKGFSHFIHYNPDCPLKWWNKQDI